MRGKSKEAFEDYVDRVNMLYANKVIGKAKRDKLLMTESKIPENLLIVSLEKASIFRKKPGRFYKVSVAMSGLQADL